MQEEATPEEATPEEATPEEATPEKAMPEEATPEKATLEKAMPEEVTREEAMQEEATPGEAAQQRAMLLFFVSDPEKLPDAHAQYRHLPLQGPCPARKKTACVRIKTLFAEIYKKYRFILNFLYYKDAVGYAMLIIKQGDPQANEKIVSNAMPPLCRKRGDRKGGKGQKTGVCFWGGLW